MASIVINGDTSGGITLSAPTVAGSNTQTLVAATGTLAPLVAGTAVSASGTSVDFTGIPSWVKRITVMFSGVSTNGTSPVQIQIGAGSFSSTGYVSSSFGVVPGSSYSGGVTSGFPLEVANATYTAAATVRVGIYVLTNISGNSWVASGSINKTNDNTFTVNGGSLTLSGTLDRVRITTVNGTDTFDAGTINILYE